MAADASDLLLNRDDSVLVLVDIQTRLLAAMPAEAARTMLDNSVRLLAAAKLLNVPVLLTEQYPQGLGPTNAAILDQLPENCPRLAKSGFSCRTAEGFDAGLEATGRRQVVLLGQETHVCVLQTAIELLGQGYRVFVVEDAVCSRLETHKLNALTRLRDAGVSIVNHGIGNLRMAARRRPPSFQNAIQNATLNR